MARLVDTNVLVYRFDPRDPRKQQIARDALREGLARRELVLAHQCLVEFVSAVTRPQTGGEPLLGLTRTAHEIDELLTQFEIVYPTEELLRLALRGAATYQLSWYDAHLWAYAEHYGLDVLLSEDFQHGRRYGKVTVVNPFTEA